MKNKLKAPTTCATMLLLTAVLATVVQAHEPREAKPSQGPRTERRRPQGEGVAVKETLDRKTVELATAPTRPRINVQIRYNKEYGYQSETDVLGGGRGPTSCHLFSVSGGTTTSIRREIPIMVTRPEEMRLVDGYYICEFKITELPFGVPINVEADLSGERSLSTEPWKGGSQARPLPGQRRVILNGKQTVTLTNDQPVVTLSFEMSYRSSAQPGAVIEFRRPGTFVKP